MEIVDYEMYEVPPRWLFLRIETSTGLCGWGEPIVEGRARTVRTAVEEVMENYLIGRDPTKIEDHWQAMYRRGFYRGGPVLMSTIAGVDQALWDIKGRIHGIPVYEFLGGKSREKIRVYQWIGGDRPDDIAAEARRLVDAGYTALKMDATDQLQHVGTPATTSDIVDRISHVRDVVGDEIDICVDFRGRVSQTMAKRLLTRFEDLDLMFVEEPVLPEHNDALPRLDAHTTTPLATGERMYTRWEMKSLIESGAVDIVQPNVSHAGGITEMMKIGAVAETYEVAMAPNCPLGPIALAASLQLDTVLPNFLIQDQGFDIRVDGVEGANGYLEKPFDFEDGFITVSDDPGLGIEVDESRVEERSKEDINWHNPSWRYADGSVAEW